MTIDEQYDLLIGQRYAAFDDLTVSTIARRINTVGKMTVADVQSLNLAAMTEIDMKRLTKELAALTGQNISDIERLYGDALGQAHLARRPLYDYRGIPFLPLDKNKPLQAIVRAYAKITAETMINITATKALGFVTGPGHFVDMRSYIYDALGNATIAVASGTSTFGEAVTNAIKQLGGSGVRIHYGSGVTRSLESVVRQNVLRGAKQARNEYEQMIGEELGCDGIEIDWHPFPRPSHVFMQGRQFAKHGGKMIDGEYYPGADFFRNEDGETVNEALEDYGCLHFKTEIILGVSEPLYTPQEIAKMNAETQQPIDVDGVQKTGYEWKQSMRALERETRTARRAKAGYKAVGDAEGTKICNRRIETLLAEYDAISEKTGIKQDYERTAIVRALNKLQKNI